jgi:magnesium and cobalt exporter, CNNM family
VSDLARILAVLWLVAANAFFVVGEYAVVTARRAGLRERASSGRRGARAALRLMDSPVWVISTVQVGITAVGILTGAIGEPLVRDVLGEGISPWLGAVIAFAVVTYLSVVCGELVPKALTLAQAERLAVLIAWPVELISVILRPVVWVLERSARVVLAPFGAGLTVEQALDRVVAAPHDRYPVAEGGVDRIRGVVHVRDLWRPAAAILRRWLGSSRVRCI